MPTGNRGITMKNIVLVAMNNVSVAVVANKGQNQYKAVQASNSKIALLTNLKTVLSGIPTNDDLSAETRQVIIGSKSPIIGLVTGTWREYIKTGKNAKGVEIAEEELALWKQVAELYANRCFNVKFTSDQYIGKNDKATKDLINVSWELVKQEVRKANDMAQPSQPKVAQSAPAVNPVVAKLQELMTKALDEGDFEAYDKLEERLNKLQPAKEVAEEPVNNDPLAGADEMEFDAE